MLRIACSVSARHTVLYGTVIFSRHVFKLTVYCIVYVTHCQRRVSVMRKYQIKDPAIYTLCILRVQYVQERYKYISLAFIFFNCILLN